MASKTVADQLVSQLVEAGVRRIYGIVGDSLNPVVDAVRRTGGAAEGGIDWIHVRHEEAAAFAAAADAQVTGELAVCAGSCGPGNLHLINGLYDANRSGAPVLAIASHIPSTQIGMGYFQETHPDRLFVECSRYTEMISTPAQSPRVVQSAIQHAIAQSGVAVITLPGDIAEEPPRAPRPRSPARAPRRSFRRTRTSRLSRTPSTRLPPSRSSLAQECAVPGTNFSPSPTPSGRRSVTRCVARNGSSTTTRSTSA